jgi:hypothetical protein
MTFEQLEHAIRAACAVAEDSEVIVFGSQAILGQHRDAHHDLRQSMEADVAPKNKPERVDDIDGSLGELSPFHETFGFYVHGVSIEAAKLPEGWEDRMVKVETDQTKGAGWCIEGHDLAASKLAALRDKDREFVRVLLRENYIDAEVLNQRIRTLDIEEQLRGRILKWIELTARELNA